MKLTLRNLEDFINDRMTGMDYADLGRKYGINRQAARYRIRYLASKYPQLNFPDLRRIRYENFISKMEEKHPEWFNGKSKMGGG